MKNFIKENWISLLVIISVIIILVLVSNFLRSRILEPKMVGAVVLEHNVTADKYGNRTYSTIVKTDDGYIEEVTGLESYTYPVGNRIKVEVWRRKNK